MNTREYARRERINKLVRTFEQINKEGKILDDKELLVLVMSTYGTSRRTAQEYIDTAKAKFKTEQNAIQKEEEKETEKKK